MIQAKVFRGIPQSLKNKDGILRLKLQSLSPEYSPVHRTLKYVLNLLALEIDIQIRAHNLCKM